MSRARWLLAVLVLVGLGAAAYFLVLRDETVAGALAPSEPTAVIGSGEDAVAVAADGSLLAWLPAEAADSLPRLPIDEPPESGRLAGPVLAQAKVLGAAPAALRPYIERSYYGESGVDVILDGGIELRFGEPSQAARKWRAAAAILANPEVVALDYVDLRAPSHPAIEGEGHTLPSLP